ncbi:MAG: Fic family protein [Elusimicrobiaceae bacterium]|nr:Fic family protein [Elusimicrobiaceae bacterium]
MKIPEKAPRLSELLGTKSRQILDAMHNPNMVSILPTLIDKYDYWTEFQYKPLPEGITPDVAWALREINLAGQRIKTPIKDRSGIPFTYSLTPNAQKILHFIDRGSQSSFPINDLREVDDKKRYLLSSLMEEAIASSMIEGAATTRKEAKEMLLSQRAPHKKAEWMVVNNYTAIRHIKDNIGQPLSKELLLELHKILTNNTFSEKEKEDSGRFRRPIPEDDGVAVYDVDGTILYQPPNGKEFPQLIDELITFANTNHNGNDAPFIHPVIKAIILHFWIGYIHPFADGNGRVARSLFYWFMLKQGYWIFEYISISRLVLKRSGQYKRAYLYSELSENDLNYFLLFNLSIIERSILAMTRYIKSKETEQAENRFLFEKLPTINLRQRDILINAIKHPNREYTIAKHSALHGIAYATARQDFLSLAALGLFIKQQRNKSFIFIPVKDLHLKLTDK